MAMARAEASAKMIAAQRAHQQGLPPGNDRLTVAAWLDHFLEHHARPRLRPGSYAAYSSHVHHHLKPELGRLPLAKLTAGHVQKMLNDKAASGLAPATVQRVRATLRRALNVALRQGLVPRNVATLVDLPRATHPPVEPFTPEQARQFLAAMGDHPLEPLFTPALTVGLRQGELLGLRWSDVDLDAGRLVVRQQLQRVDGRLQLVEPKSESSRRTLALPVVAVGAIRRQRGLQGRQRLLAGDRWQDGGFVFTTSKGTPLDGSTVTHAFQRALADAGLPRQRFHDLRHACATLQLAQGVPLKVVSERLGHSQIGLTADVYSHVVPALDREAASRMDAVFEGP
jgi:integrase